MLVTVRGDHGVLTTGDTEVMAPAFPGGGQGPLTEDEQLALLDIIETINERYGLNLTDADRIWTEAQAGQLSARPEEFANNSREKSSLAFFGDMWPGAKFDSLDNHTDFIKQLVDNPEIEQLLGEAVFEAVYREARKP